MLKINLLPPHINTKRMVRVASVIVALLIAGEVAFLLWMKEAPTRELARLTTRLSDTNAGIAELNAMKTEADAAIAKAGEVKPKFDFINDMLVYNRAYPQVYERTAAYTYRDVMMTSISATPNTVAFDAYATNPSAVSLMMLGLSNSPHFQGLPQVSGLPGYDDAQELQRRAEERQQQQVATGALLPGTTIIGGYGSNSGVDTGTAAPMGPGGMMPGMPMGGPAGGSAMMPGMQFGGPGGGSNGPTSGAAGAAMMRGMMGMGGGGSAMGMGGPAMGMGGGGGGDALSRLGIETARKKPRGFIVSVALVLAKPIVRPTYGSADAQAGAGGGGGMMGPMGMMGGGMMGGSMSPMPGSAGAGMMGGGGATAPGFSGNGP